MTEEFGMDEILAQGMDVTSGSVVDGTVVGQMDSYLLVNVGLKQEAALPLKEFNQAIPPVGEKIPVLIVRVSGPEGRPLVSWRQARERANWDKIASAFEKKEVIEGKIVQRIKGGVTVDIGLDAFMPASQIDDRPVHNPEEWVGRSVKVQVLEMDRSKGSVLVSRRRILEQEKAVRRVETLQNIKEGQVLKGRVTGLTNFGAFVDIGGVEGLLHVSDLAWVRVDNPKKVVSVGDELEVKILKYDPATHRISLGRKQLLPHPWEGIELRFPVGGTVKGKVTGLADFGAFVEIEPGVDGLIHLSELSWTERVKHPKELLKVGQEIEAKLLAIDRDKEKISLSLKRMGASPWDQAARAYPVGSRVQGEITHIAPFGAFVRVAPGVEALLRVQDLSWTERIQSPQQLFKAGDKIEALVLEVNTQQEKMAIGIKQLSPDPLKAVKVGQEVKGKVVKSAEFGLIVKLDSGLEALIRSSEFHNEKSIFSDSGSRAPEQETQSSYKEGDEVTASVIKILKKERKIELSIRKYERHQEKELLKKYSGKNDRLTIGETTGWKDNLTQE